MPMQVALVVIYLSIFAVQVAGCGKDLSKEKDYYQRYRVCGEHLNLSALRFADGQEQRFCQQCGKFHPLGEFDGERKYDL